MKTSKFLLSGLAFFGLAGSVLAQSQEDALRFSRLDFGGTARVQGLAGANQALGADISSLAGNPAGLGLFRRSEFNVTPGLTFNETLSKANGVSTSDNRNNFNISSVGVVFTDRKDDADMSDWRSGSFGIGFTRLNNFQNSVSYHSQIDSRNSIVYYFADEAFFNNRTVAGLNDEFNSNNIYSLEGLAWATYLLDIDTARNEFTVPALAGQVRQQEDIITRGAQYQWDFAYGASYRDKLFIGGSIGIMSSRYVRERMYREIDTDANTDFEQLVMSDELRTTGTGINLRVGLIYKPSDIVRFGASVQTPTWSGYKDKFDTSLSAKYASDGTFTASAVPGEYSYNIYTPFRANGGVAVFASKYGFFTADVEFVNYGSTRFAVTYSDDVPPPTQDEKDYFRAVNNNMRRDYQKAFNLRFGAEGRYNIFRFRAGYAHYGSPYSDSSLDGTKSYRTAGVGIRQQRTYLDLAYVNSSVNSLYSPFEFRDGGGETVVKTDNDYHGVLVTFGVNF